MKDEPTSVIPTLRDYEDGREQARRVASQNLYEVAYRTWGTLEEWEDIGPDFKQRFKDAIELYEKHHPYAERTRTIHDAVEAMNAHSRGQ